MRGFFHKYTLKFIFCALSLVIILSCVRRHKFDFEKNQLSNVKMSSIMVDVLLMEAYVNEKMPRVRIDTITPVKMEFYKKILEKHKTDSAAFFTTFNYLQAHPKELMAMMHLVDSTLNRIQPTDTSQKPAITIPKNLEKLPNFSEQEKALQKEYIKEHAGQFPGSKIK